MRKFIKYILVIVSTVSIFAINSTVSAKDLTTVAGSETTTGYIVDNDGSVTGTPGAKYYNANSWKDMFDTYKTVSSSAVVGSLVTYNLIGDVQGSTAFLTGQLVKNGVGVNIIGNGHTVYADSDTTPSTSPGRIATSGFYANVATIGNKTNLKINNATIINSNSNGIFPVTTDSTASVYYKDMIVKNGGNSGASPLRNDDGTIYLSGINDFTMKELSKDAGVDNQGEWIQGGKNVVVTDGKTTIHQSWGMDQPFYVVYNTGHTLSINDDAELIWDLGYTYTMYYDDGNSGPMTWNIGKNAKFLINGTSQTASRGSDWFMATAFSSWKLNVEEQGQLKVSTGGGSLNLNAFTGAVNWNFAKNSDIEFDNLNTSKSLVSGTAHSGSKINIADAKSVLLKTKGGKVFNDNVDIPIEITGSGLRLHASSAYDAGTDSDLYKRISTGTTTSDFAAANMTPTTYTSADLAYLQAAKYAHWYQPTGLRFNTSTVNRTYNVKLSDLPGNGSFSPYLGATEPMKISVQDDRGVKPNFSVQVKLLSNETPNVTKYGWQDSNNSVTTVLNNNVAYDVLSVTNDDGLPANTKMSGAGLDYTTTFDQSSGLMLSAKNSLVASQDENATVQYLLVDGPGSN